MTNQLCCIEKMMKGSDWSLDANDHEKNISCLSHHEGSDRETAVDTVLYKDEPAEEQVRIGF